MYQKNLFDEWPERYESWFSTPIGKLVKSFETELILELARPGPYEKTLDAGCGTGVFTSEFLANKASVTGLDISRPMLEFAAKKFKRYSFQAVQGNITCLPFKDNYFDITISITTLEFVEDARAAVNELFRVTKSEGIILVATLNSLSPWAARRNAKTQKGEKHVLETAYYRSPGQLRELSRLKGIVKTAIHFQKDDDPVKAFEIETSSRINQPDTGAFVAIKWIKS